MQPLSFPDLPSPVSAPRPSMAPGGYGERLGQYSMGAPVPAITASGMDASPGSMAGMGAAGSSVNALSSAMGAAAPGQDSGMGGLGGMIGDTFMKDGALDMGNLGSLAKILGSFGMMWQGFQANKTAKDSLEFQKDAYGTNLANQISSYNLSLKDRINARYAQQGQSQSEADKFISENRLEK